MKVAVAGYGQEGEANYRYWQKLGAKLTILDENQPNLELPTNAEVKIGLNCFDDLRQYDLVVRTAGLNPNKLKSAKKVWSATNEFFAQCPASIIGITGTKGKGTTSSLIAEILQAAGETVHLLGNIGVPALSELSKIKSSDFVVFELSSFQLWDLEKSPETAVVLMIAPDHMDVHASMAEYIDAKANIGVHQKQEDLLVYHPTNTYSAEAAQKSAAQKRRYLTQEGAYIQNNKVCIEEVEVCAISEIGLIGPHNLENVCAAVTAAWNYTQDTNAIKQGIINFKGLPHRLEFVAERNMVKFYNDSQATGPDSTIAAIRSFSEPVVLILGGSDKGLDVDPVINELDENIHRVVLVGQSAENLEELCMARNFNHYINLGLNTNMQEIVSEAIKLSSPGGVVLLSPAHASFGMFKNYQDRGDQFKNIVKAL